MGTWRLLNVCCWLKAGAIAAYFFSTAHHRCLGFGRALPYSARRGKQSVVMKLSTT